MAQRIKLLRHVRIQTAVTMGPKMVNRKTEKTSLFMSENRAVRIACANMIRMYVIIANVVIMKYLGFEVSGQEYGHQNHRGL